MSTFIPGLCICICTYKRSTLLRAEILDLLAQTAHPENLIIVDGDPQSTEVLEMLRSLPYPSGWRVTYVPSNHSNLSYQRYLGWRAASGHRLLLYFDDDLRIPDTGAVVKVIAPFDNDDFHDVVGVTALTRAKGWDHFGDPDMIRSSEQAPQLLLRWFGESSNLNPGDLSSTGNRLYPPDDREGYAEVKWLQGRVMAYRLDAMAQGTFSEDMFALDEIRCGLGEDTFLSTRVAVAGRLLISFNSHFDHPDDDTPKSYPYKAYKLAYARAYSRRFLNDHYRAYDKPRLEDRFNLVKSYVGNSLFNWLRAITQPKRSNLAYAWGYLRGALRGVFQSPTARRLTPGVDWWGDADAALAQRIDFEPGRLDAARNSPDAPAEGTQEDDSPGGE